MIEGVHSLGHLVGRNIGKAEVSVDGTLTLTRGREVECRAIGLDGVHRTTHLHETVAQLA